MADLSHLTASSLFDCKGWVAVITGGGTGLGLMAAHALAANGARVYITGRRNETLKAAEAQASTGGGSIVGIEMDVTSKQSIQNVADAIARREGFVNVLVNNAGIYHREYPNRRMPQGTPAEISAQLMEASTFDHWRDLYTTNVASVYFTSVAFLPLLCATRDHGHAESGNIINVSSICALTRTSQDGQFTYNSSKAALASVTSSLANDWRKQDMEVRVNMIAPGWFPSEMVRPEEFPSLSKDFWKDSLQVPLGRIGSRRDYAQAVLSLASNRYCTGSTLLVDGGWLLAHA